jgi:propanol-preferring alcohol dehydrogenase
MRVMQLTQHGAGRLEPARREIPAAGAGEVVARVLACGVCRTDLHVVDGELPDAPTPIVPGHEIVAAVEQIGDGVDTIRRGDRIGIPWLGWACGRCEFCRRGDENLCRAARYTGFHLDGGYAEYVRADARYCVRLPGGYDDPHAAPLLCAGLIGYRAYRMAGTPRRLGLYGFGAAAHILAQVARHDGREVYAFVPPGDDDAMRFALTCGVTWAGPSTVAPPVTLDSAIIFAPVGALVPAALAAVRPGGTVVCAGIHMSDIPAFPYRLLWEERCVRSVANLTRADAESFLDVTARIHIDTHVHVYGLRDANRALADLRAGRFTGAAVLVPQGEPEE